MTKTGLNSFGPPGQQLPLFDPRLIREARVQFDRALSKELALANSFYMLAGRLPSVGWILLQSQYYKQIANLYATNFQLNITDFINGQITLNNLIIVQARCVTTGVANDGNAVYLVQIADQQALLLSPWWDFPINAQYNVRSPAYPGQYYANSLNSGNPWTWSTMLGNIWGLASPFLGSYPGLPTSPTGTPENYIYNGVNIQDCLNENLDNLGLTLTTNLQLATNPYGIAVAGAADAAFAALQAKYIGSLEDDFAWIDVGAGRVPGKWIVNFHRRNQFYGTEETVRNDYLQWASTPIYSAGPVASPAPYNEAPGTGVLWDDFTVEFDIDGNPLAGDVVTANTIATERVIQAMEKVYRGTQGFMRQMYAGALPFTTGSLVDCVRWYQSDFRKAWRTELSRGFYWPECFERPPYGSYIE